MKLHRGEKITIGLCLLSVLIGLFSGAMATTISIDPENPEPASEITFTIDIDQENVTEVWIIIQECKGSDFCYVPQNISMAKVTDFSYEKAVTLHYDDSTYIEYYTNIKRDSGWEKTEPILLYLSTPSNGNGSTNGDDTNNTPGFEGTLLLLSLAVVVFFVSRKKRVQ